MTPCADAIWSAREFVPEVDTERCALLNAAPACPHCGGPARPNILMFGDGGWLPQRADTQAQRQDSWLSKSSRPVVIEIGAGPAIPSVRHFSDKVLQDHNGRLIRINPREPAVPTRLDIALPCGALDALTVLDGFRQRRR
jgi:NAD-dependent SIR2 family protein deacetylase